MSWTDSQIESLITFYSSVLVSGARNFATGVKNRRQKPTPVFWRRFLAPVSGACHGHYHRLTPEGTASLTSFLYDGSSTPVQDPSMNSRNHKKNFHDALRVGKLFLLTASMYYEITATCLFKFKCTLLKSSGLFVSHFIKTFHSIVINLF